MYYTVLKTLTFHFRELYRPNSKRSYLPVVLNLNGKVYLAKLTILPKLLKMWPSVGLHTSISNSLFSIPTLPLCNTTFYPAMFHDDLRPPDVLSQSPLSRLLHMLSGNHLISCSITSLVFSLSFST